MTTLREIVNLKNYPLIECKSLCSDNDDKKTDEQCGYCSYMNGQLKAIDNNVYSLDDLYVKSQEFVLQTPLILGKLHYPAGTICLTVWSEEE